ncbi:TetR/AcrR family transcriptional regulator [Myxococcota bacterium]|nr:TetR/AcrR family transcriptional regulator [Myxococcota bacterium]
MTRAYRQTARAEGAAARRRAVIESVGAILVEHSFEDMTLAEVARRSGVSLKTVVRQFGTREGLLRAAMEAARADEEAQREVPVGDVPAIVAVLASRYEPMGEFIYRMGDAEVRHEWLTVWVQNARRSHLAWLAQAFAPWLPPELEEAERERRLMCLFWATEVRCWWALRQRLGQSPEQTAAVMRDTLDALAAGWAHDEGKAK